jgi:hypothetical protein
LTNVLRAARLRVPICAIGGAAVEDEIEEQEPAPAVVGSGWSDKELESTALPGGQPDGAAIFADGVPSQASKLSTSDDTYHPVITLLP